VTEEYELETSTTLWQGIFLKSKVNGAPYEEQQVESKWPWPANTYLQRRLKYLRGSRFSEEAFEAGVASQMESGDANVQSQSMSDIRSSLESVESSSGLASLECDVADSGSPTPLEVEELGSKDNKVSIELPSEDWSWFANPNHIPSHV
jgi:hypothetical protein